MAEPLRVACLGMGWWSDVLADAIKRSDKIRIVSCFSRDEGKRNAFAAKYACKAAPSYEAILADPEIEAVDIEVVWDPVWTKDRIRADARQTMRELGIVV